MLEQHVVLLSVELGQNQYKANKFSFFDFNDALK